MSNRNMQLDVIVRLKDLLSGPLRGLRGALEGVANMAKKIGLVGVAVAGISFMGPIHEAAAFQQKLLDIAGTSQLSGKAAFEYVDKAKGQFEGLALKYGQFSETIAEGAGKMIAAGVAEDVVNASMGSIAKATKAANASFDDMSGVAISLVQTLKVPASQLDDIFAALIVAGKEGSFELKDMARYFPTLTGQMAKLGITGKEAAVQLASMLEIARKGTAEPAEAANNLNNFLSKITSPETIKNFKKMNVDIVGVMQDAATKGINPIEAVIQKISKLAGVSGKEINGMMKKAKAAGMTDAEALEDTRKKLIAIHGSAALGGLFSDMQVMGFLIPMLANIEEYKRIKEEVGKATGAMSDKDFETQMAGLNTQLMMFNEIGTQAMREVGFAFGTWLPQINENLQAALGWVRELDKSSGGMVKQFLAWAGAGVLVAGALGVLGVILPVIGAGLSLLASPAALVIGGLAAAGVWLFRNWSTYGPRIMALWNRLKTGLVDLGNATLDYGRKAYATVRDLATRYGPMIADGLGNAWTKAINGLRAGYQSVRDFGAGFAINLPKISGNIDETISAITRIASAFMRLARAGAALLNIDLPATENFFRGLGTVFGAMTADLTGGIAKVADVIASVTEVLADLAEGKRKLSDIANELDKTFNFSGFIAAARQIPTQMVAIGSEIIQSLWDGMKAKFDEVIAWFSGLGQRIKDAIGSIKLDIQVPEIFKRFGGMFGTDSEPPKPANSNTIAPAQAPPQRLDVKVNSTIKVDGPGKVVSENTEVKKPSGPIDTGRVLGRN
ncbi:Phage-related minor tail protein [Ensifer adhaerens]|nr:Phage-related minor tail protein [Ensifer adhaerens]